MSRSSLEYNQYEILDFRNLQKFDSHCRLFGKIWRILQVLLKAL